MNKYSDMKHTTLQKASWYFLPVLLVICCLAPSGAFAAGPPVPSEMSKPMAQVLMLIIVALALMIALLANVVNGAAQIYLQKIKETRKNPVDGSAAKTLSLLVVLLMSSSLFAAADPATATAPASNDAYGGLAATSFYALITVIFIELIILLTLLYNLKMLLAKDPVAVAAKIPKIKTFSWAKWWEKVNSFRPVHEESNIDLGHDYDGIRELDNRLPPWWLYGFYLCILFAFIYIYRFHIAHTAPLPKEELQIAMTQAAAEKEAYLKNAASKVDENTVTYLTDAASLAAGKKVFSTICMACHQADGGGGVGPNLTDQYWIHGGSIKDIFKTIKYGWPEKGMKSWEDDYSPVQIAQIASYVKSLGGTKPAKPKEPQGTLFQENTTTPATDSAKTDKKVTAAN